MMSSLSRLRLISVFALLSVLMLSSGGLLDLHARSESLSCASGAHCSEFSGVSHAAGEDDGQPANPSHDPANCPTCFLIRVASNAAPAASAAEIAFDSVEHACLIIPDDADVDPAYPLPNRERGPPRA